MQNQTQKILNDGTRHDKSKTDHDGATFDVIGFAISETKNNARENQKLSNSFVEILSVA